jgi:hypothetical protein
MAETRTKRTTKRAGATTTRTNSNRGNARKRRQAAKRAVSARAGAARGLTRRGAELAREGKTPIIAGAAAAAGFAGGAVLTRNNPGRRVLGVRMPRMSRTPSPGKALASAASEIGKAGYKVGQLTSEVRRVREQVEK